jgi:hypothetical protein
MFKKGEGGRKPGSKNRLTLAKAAARAEAMKMLNSSLPADAFDGDAIALFQRIYRDPSFDAELRLEAAARIAQFERKESTPAEQQRYVVVMPLPANSLEEWKARYAIEMPDATPEQYEQHEGFARQILEKNKALDRNRADKAPWLNPEDDAK